MCGHMARMREDTLAPMQSVTRHVLACMLHLAECTATIDTEHVRPLVLSVCAAREQEGTLAPANAGDGMLTLTGWSAALGLLAIVVVAVVGAGLAYRRYKGYDQMSTYTLVNKGLAK